MIHNPAKGVSCGLVRSTDGIITPIAPNKFTGPRSLTLSGETCPIHGIITAIFSIGINFITAPINKSANSLHEMFTTLLQRYRVDSTYFGLLKEQLEFTYNNLIEKNTDLKKELTLKLSEAQTKIKNVKERFATGEIERNLYAEVSVKLKKEKSDIETEIEKTGSRVSNLEKLINYTMDLSSKLHTTWKLSDYTDKQNLQKVIFPDGIQYSRKEDEYLTPSINRIFEFVLYFSKSYDGNKEGIFDNFVENSHLVPGTGIEPVLPLRETGF